jgi:hypothetical protein
MAVYDSFLYVASGTGGLHFLKLNNNFELSRLCTYTTAHRMNDVAVSGAYVTVPDFLNEYAAFDAIVPPCPVTTACMWSSGTATSATSIGANFNYVAVGLGSAYSICVIIRLSCSRIRTISTPSPIYFSTIHPVTDHIYAGCGTGLFIYDTYGTQLGNYTACGRVYSLSVTDSLIAVGTASSVYILDITDPASITLIASYAFTGTGQVSGVYIDKNEYTDVVFCACSNIGLKMLHFDKASSSIDVIASWTPPSGNVRDVVVRNTVVFAIADTFIYALDHKVNPAYNGYRFINTADDIWVYADSVPLWEDFRYAYSADVVEDSRGNKRPAAKAVWHALRANDPEFAGSCWGMCMTTWVFL